MIIGVDPHKASHTATAVNPAMNAPMSSLRVDATLAGYRQLLRWGKAFPERQWAVENAHGLGQHLAQWLIARGETVIDVHTTATARVREPHSVGRCYYNRKIAEGKTHNEAMRCLKRRLADHVWRLMLLDERLNEGPTGSLTVVA